MMGERGKGVGRVGGGGGGGVGTGKGTGKSMRKLCRNYPLANYPLVRNARLFLILFCSQFLEGLFAQFWLSVRNSV